MDTTIRIWNAHTGELKQTFYGHRSLTSELAFGSEQNILVSSNADETIRVWHMNSGKCVHVLAGKSTVFNMLFLVLRSVFTLNVCTCR